MKGRFTSFQRFGRVFGLPGSIVSKYPASILITDKRQIYDETKDEYKYFPQYDYQYAELSEEERKKGKYDCHDNYGVMSKGINKWRNEAPRLAKEDIEQFDPNNAQPRKWPDPKNPEIAKLDDFTPIAQENIPLVVEGNHEETLLERNSDNLLEKQINSGPGFQETHPNRPAIREKHALLRSEKQFLLPLKIPVKNFHSILACTKEIEITSSINVNFTLKSKSTQGGGVASGTFSYECLNTGTCPPFCKSKSKYASFSCCNPTGSEVASLSISSNRSLATLKRFKEYAALTDKEPIELDLSRNVFQEQRKYALYRIGECIAKDYKFPIVPTEIKMLVNASPKTKLDAGCLTTPYTHGRFNSYKFDKGDMLSERLEVDGCVEGTAGTTIFRAMDILDIPTIDRFGWAGADIWDNTGGHYYPSSSPYAGGPSIAFRMYETQGNALFSDPRIELIPDVMGKWYSAYKSTQCTDYMGNTISGRKLNSELFKVRDYNKRFLTTKASGTCIGHLFPIAFCSQTIPEPCKEGIFNACTEKWEGRTCTCESNVPPPCDKTLYEENYGTEHMSSRYPMDDIVCHPNASCCKELSKLPNEVAEKYGSALSFSGHLGRFVRVLEDEVSEDGGKILGKSLPFPINDTLGNKEEIEAALIYSLGIESDAHGGDIGFYFTQEAADYHQGISNSFGTWSTRKCGKLTITHEDWSYETDIYAPIFEQTGSTFTYDIPLSQYVSPVACGALMVCEKKTGQYGRACDCEGEICEQGDPSKGCGCDTRFNGDFLGSTPYYKQLICRNGYFGGVDEPLCPDGGACTGCHAYPDERPLCTDPPCCSEDAASCKCKEIPVCGPPKGEVELECSSMDLQGLESKYDVNAAIAITFKSFKELEG